ncbi:hypothetical protein ARMGADRAFT_476507 [Armillaria gallica]|uniref:Uncharacterized protein n=1 Tax=Armillaria gallica TaxID=47427 RepID=A0A2H3D885_ARMGA|nr:hypothetical protein ARMGADRAFT_476507 [Armillaria gallica]
MKEAKKAFSDSLLCFVPDCAGNHCTIIAGCARLAQEKSSRPVSRAGTSCSNGLEYFTNKAVSGGFGSC